jgi:hypothetical protein
MPLPAQGGVIRSRLLPGFQFRLADLYRLPELPELIEDPVYESFVSPFLRAARIRAEEAEVRTAQAESRAKRYAAQLKALGITPDNSE